MKILKKRYSLLRKTIGLKMLQEALKAQIQASNSNQFIR